MTTKETFLGLGISYPYHEIAEKVDFVALDEFVTMFIDAYASRRGHETVQKELLTDSLSETTIFLTRMIEVGSVQFMTQNNLISDNEEDTENIAFVVASAINISMASELQRTGLDQLGGNIFFDIMALMGLIERVNNHVSNARKDPTYTYSLVSFNLLGLVNGDTVE